MEFRYFDYNNRIGVCITVHTYLHDSLFADLELLFYFDYYIHIATKTSCSSLNSGEIDHNPVDTSWTSVSKQPYQPPKRCYHALLYSGKFAGLYSVLLGFSTQKH